MFARVSTLQGDPKESEKAIQTAEEQVVPKIRELKGCKGFYYLVDRSSGKSLGITLWESKQDLDASVQAANQIRSATAEKAGASIVSVEQFEIAIQELL